MSILVDRAEEDFTVRDRRAITIDSDALGIAMLQLKIQQTQGLFNDHFAELQQRLNDIKVLRDSMSVFRAATANDIKAVLEGTVDNDELENAIETLRVFNIAIPDTGLNADDIKEALIQSLDGKITHLNTTNQQGLIKVQQYQNEIHLAQDQLSAIESRRNRTAEKISAGIKGN